MGRTDVDVTTIRSNIAEAMASTDQRAIVESRATRILCVSFKGYNPSIGKGIVAIPHCDELSARPHKVVYKNHRQIWIEKQIAEEFFMTGNVSFKDTEFLPGHS